MTECAKLIPEQETENLTEITDLFSFNQLVKESHASEVNLV